MKNTSKKTNTKSTRKPGIRAARGRKVGTTQPKAKRTRAVVIALPAPEPIVRVTKSVVRDVFKIKAQNGILRADVIGTAIKSAFLGANDGREACDELLKDNGLEVGRWAGKNTGMLRMNLTNVARAMLRNGGTFAVRGKLYDATKGLKQVEA